MRAIWMVPLVLAACGGPTDEEIAREIFTEIDGQWESWGTAPNWDGIQASSDCTHGNYVKITFNELALNAYGDEDLPDGSIVVKRGYDNADGTGAVGFVTVMKKIDGYDPARNDWFWARIADDGTPSDSAVGQASFCYGCHSAGGTDYLLTIRDLPGEGDCEDE